MVQLKCGENMFLRKTIVKSIANWSFVESYCEIGKSKQKIILYSNRFDLFVTRIFCIKFDGYVKVFFYEQYII